jgi:hypothetical protein
MIQHKLFPTMEAMLTPEALSDLKQQHIGSVQQNPLLATYNKSGSHLLSILTNEGLGPKFIVKRVSLDWDWQMRATDDHNCRAVTLWEHGILDQLPAQVRHGVVACARDRDGWALLMEDVSGSLLPYAPLRKHHNHIFLDSMAAMHATFFEDSQLKDPDLNLCTLYHTYTVFGPQTAGREINGLDEVPQRVREGWQLVEAELPADIVEMILPLVEDPTPLCRALSHYPFTLVHGDWRHANQGLISSGRKQYAILLDWQLAAAVPPVIELARYLGTNSALFPVSKESCIAYYKRSLAKKLGRRFDEEWWQPQLTLGLLGGFVQDGWAITLKATRWEITAHQRTHWQTDLQWWIDKIRVGARYLLQQKELS